MVSLTETSGRRLSRFGSNDIFHETTPLFEAMKVAPLAAVISTGQADVAASKMGELLALNMKPVAATCGEDIYVANTIQKLFQTMAWDARTMVSRKARQAKRGPPLPPLKAGKGIMLMLDGPPCSRPAFLKHREAHGTGRGGNFELPMSTTVNELHAKLMEASYGATDLWAACWQGHVEVVQYLLAEPTADINRGRSDARDAVVGEGDDPHPGREPRSKLQCRRATMPSQTCSSSRSTAPFDYDELIYIFLAGTVLFLLRSTVLNTILIATLDQIAQLCVCALTGALNAYLPTV